MSCRSKSAGGFLHGALETRVKWRVLREPRNMSAIAADARAAMLTMEAVTIYPLAV